MIPYKSTFLSFVAGALLVIAQDDSVGDLGEVLGDNRNLRTYNELIRRFPDILLQLPSADGITIIAPSNEAFENIPYTALNEIWDPEDEDITVPLLQYHILRGAVSIDSLEIGPTYILPSLLTNSRLTNVTSGQNVLINKQSGDDVVFTSGVGTRCTLDEGDIPFQGGIIHVVDNLLLPPTRLDETSQSFGITSFLGGLYAADLMPAVADRRNVTVFAPQDAAFDIVGGSLEDMDAEELARIMGYHVVPNQVLVSSSLTNGTRLETLTEDADGNLASIAVRQSGNNKYINSAQILQPDILLANGILHIISNVLNPDAGSVMPNPEIGTQPPVFPVSTVSDAFTSALPCTTDCPVTTTSSREDGTRTTSVISSATDETTSLSTSSSDDAAGARCTMHVGAALGIMGVGAMAWL